ncbi:MAG: MptD family putative ECF transporter S component [Treponema phagedenis]|uniref:MptD family putative ECF transporter S component n=1 Tax=Treponema phagedenis TaxID=162 RepID=UPI003133D3F4
MQKQSFNAKDLINVGVYTAIYLVVFFVVGMMNAITILYTAMYVVLPVVTGIPFMLFLTKVEKFGMVSIMAAILGIFWYFMGYTWLAPVGYIICGIAADLILKSGDYKSFKMDVIGFWIFSCGLIGCQMPMWIMADTYMAGVEQQMGSQYASALAKYMPWWMGLVGIAILLVGAIIGANLGRKMLKKHFTRAGIV